VINTIAMDIAVQKLELLDWVMHLKDHSIFEKLLALKAEAEEITDNQIVGYTVLGEPLNISQYRAHVQKGIDDMNAGRVTSHEDLLNEMESW
jgi:hypothetical protein